MDDSNTSKIKKIGLLGGTSWPSTITYYKRLNELANDTFGEFHSARILLHSIDYNDIKSRYTMSNGWSEIPDLLLNELNELISTGVDCIVICNNTLHKALSILEQEKRLPTSIPYINIIDCAGQKIQKENHKDIVLFATKFTMEDGFYAERLKNKFNVNVHIPSINDRDLIQKIQSEVVSGNISEESISCFKEVLSRYDHYDSIVLACTELPLLISEEITSSLSTKIIDTIEEQCLAAANFAFHQ